MKTYTTLKFTLQVIVEKNVVIDQKRYNILM